MGQRYFLQSVVLVELDNCVQKMKLECFLTLYTKINSKWTKDLNIRPEMIKLLEENIDRTLYDISHSKIPCDLHPRVMEIKTKINKWNLI